MNPACQLEESLSLPQDGKGTSVRDLDQSGESQALYSTSPVTA